MIAHTYTRIHNHIQQCHYLLIIAKKDLNIFIIILHGCLLSNGSFATWCLSHFTHTMTNPTMMTRQQAK
jgi:hypothetical protein